MHLVEKEDAGRLREVSPLVKVLGRNQQELEPRVSGSRRYFLEDDFGLLVPEIEGWTGYVCQAVFGIPEADLSFRTDHLAAWEPPAVSRPRAY